MKSIKPSHSLIYTALVLVIGWFSSIGCNNLAPTRPVSPPPCMVDVQGKPVCPSPSPQPSR